MSEYIPVELRRKVRLHFQNRCAYCQSSESLTVVTFEVEHILPRSLGGVTEFNNLCLACPMCNRHKANRVSGNADSGLETRMFHPQLDRWNEHFDWSVNGTLIVGLTDVALVTIKLLRMNRTQLVDLRFLWSGLGLHPPK